MPAKTADVIGKRFGRLLVESRAGTDKHYRATWHCRCDCGASVEVASRALKSGNTRSCGCMWLEAARSPKKHGLTHAPEYRTWISMKGRCNNPNHTSYPYYGGRGIGYHQSWESVDRFYADMGPRPSPKHSIERIDNDKDYGPDNCRWATMKEQAQNRRPIEQPLPSHHKSKR